MDRTTPRICSICPNTERPKRRSIWGLPETTTPDTRPGRPAGGYFDEVFGPGGTPRGDAVALVDELERLGADALAQAGHRRDAIFLQQGMAPVQIAVSLVGFAMGIVAMAILQAWFYKRTAASS